MIRKSALVGRRFSLPGPLCIAPLAALVFATGVAAAADPGEIRATEKKMQKFRSATARQGRADDMTHYKRGTRRQFASRSGLDEAQRLTGARSDGLAGEPE